MELGLGGKIALVTGGSKGIGRATTLRLLEEGGSVLACARSKAGLDELIEAAGDLRARLVTVEADLTRIDDIQALFKRCDAAFGTLDILVNNAGSARPGDFQKITDQEWHDDFSLKFFGYVRMARAAMPRMARNASGSVIVNVIGTGGLRPSAAYMVGGAANAALNHFTKALADEGAKHHVRVVGINPGPILTERLKLFSERAARGRDMQEIYARMTPLGRPGKPEEVADLIAFLASERAAFIHGANITIDGGANSGLMG